MDEIALQTLGREMLDDCRVASDAYAKARDRFARGDEVGYEACAHHLSRMFNGIEQMGLRVAKAFENNIDDEQGWHTGLLKRLGLEIPGVRPALLPAELKLPLHELKGFRHVIVHAYSWSSTRRSYNCSWATRRGSRKNWSRSPANSSARLPTSKVWRISGSSTGRRRGHAVIGYSERGRRATRPPYDSLSPINQQQLTNNRGRPPALASCPKQTNVAALG